MMWHNRSVNIHMLMMLYNRLINIQILMTWYNRSLNIQILMTCHNISVNIQVLMTWHNRPVNIQIVMMWQNRPVNIQILMMWWTVSSSEGKSWLEAFVNSLHSQVVLASSKPVYILENFIYLRISSPLEINVFYGMLREGNNINHPLKWH